MSPIGIFFLIINLILFFAPGLIAARHLDSAATKTPLAHFLFYSVLVSSVLISLVFSFLSHFFGLPITSQTIPAVLFFLAAAFFSAHRLYHHSHPSALSKSFSLPPPNLPVLVFLTIFSAGILLIGRAHFYHHPPLPGPDSFVYLYQSAVVVNSGHPHPAGFDRNLVQILPALISFITGFTVETSLKLFVILLFILGSLVVYLLTATLTRPSLALLAYLLATFCMSLVRQSWDIYASLLGFILVFAVFNLLLSQLKRYRGVTSAVIALFSGSLFNVHALVAFAALPLLLPPLIYLLIARRRQLIRHKAVFIRHTALLGTIFLLSGLPLLGLAPQYLYQAVVKPIVATKTQTSATLQTQNEGLENYARVRVLPGLRDFPLLRQFFVNQYGPLLIIAALLGLVIFVKHQTISRFLDGQTKIVVLLFTLSFFALTQQDYLGISWYPSRFAYGLYPLIIFFACLFYYAVFLALHKFGLDTRRTYFFLAGFTLFFVLPSINATGNFLLNQYTSPVDPNRYLFFKSVSNFISQPNLTIYSLSFENNWAVGLNPELKIYPVDPKFICLPADKPQLAPAAWLITQAFCYDTPLEHSLVTLSEFSPEGYYVILQTDATPTNPQLFLNPHYSVLYALETLYLLERT